MNNLKKRIGGAFLIASLFLITSVSTSHADQITLIDPSNTSYTTGAWGDDVSYRLSGIGFTFNGTYYSNVYFSTNNILSFGSADSAYEQGQITTPSISFAAGDWTVDWNGTTGSQDDSADEQLTATQNGSVITIISNGRLYPDGAGALYNAVTVTINLNGSGAATYSYTVNGAAGTDYSTATPGWTYARLQDGTLVSISQINRQAVIANPLMVATPLSMTMKDNSISCTPGTYKMSASEVKVSSFIYKLYINNQLVSTVANDPGRNIPSVMLDGAFTKLPGVISSSGITWDASAYKDFTAYCEITAFASSASSNSSSETMTDAAYKARIAAKAQAWEVERAAAVVANNTQAARDLRKRVAARSNS
jgi:hypothetical protein